MLADVLTPLAAARPAAVPGRRPDRRARAELVAELIREAALEGVRDELPHSWPWWSRRFPREGRPGRPDRRPRERVHRAAEPEGHRDRREGRPAQARGHHGAQAHRGAARDAGVPGPAVKVAKDWQRDPKQLRAWASTTNDHPGGSGGCPPGLALAPGHLHGDAASAGAPPGPRPGAARAGQLGSRRFHSSRYTSAGWAGHRAVCRSRGRASPVPADLGPLGTHPRWSSGRGRLPERTGLRGGPARGPRFAFRRAKPISSSSTPSAASFGRDRVKVAGRCRRAAAASPGPVR